MDDPIQDASSPAEQWNKDSVRRSLDELFNFARKYRSKETYYELIRFVARFRFYAPFNAMLVCMQMPGATYVAPSYRWVRDYRRRIRTGARPLVILQPMGPVMFVFDVSDTEPEEGAPPLPPEVTNPYEVRRGRIRDELDQTIENAKRDGVYVAEQDAGSQSAGLVRTTKKGRTVKFLVKEIPKPEFLDIPLRYELLLNAKHSREAKYATLVHELAHLYCGHLGTPDSRWWPDRVGLSHREEEFEAESVCYLVCDRLGIDNPSDAYLSNFLRGSGDDEIPAISLECVMKVSGLIEQMGPGRLKPRKEKEQ
jgi:hypothetical protein